MSDEISFNLRRQIAHNFWETRLAYTQARDRIHDLVNQPITCPTAIQAVREFYIAQHGYRRAKRAVREYRAVRFGKMPIRDGLYGILWNITHGTNRDETVYVGAWGHQFVVHLFVRHSTSDPWWAEYVTQESSSSVVTISFLDSPVDLNLPLKGAGLDGHK